MSNGLNERLIDGKFTVKHLCATSKTIVERKTADSKLLNTAAEDRIPKFGEPELLLGRVLGRGGFCVVTEVKDIKLLDEYEKVSADDPKPINIEHDEHAIHNIVQDRSFMASHCLRGKGKDCRYAIKKIQDTCYKDSSTFINGVVDLAIEARFLSVLRHANIIKMRAMSVGSPYDDKFFVVLDRLYDILTTRLIKWKKQKPAGMRKLIDRGGKKDLAFWIERCTFAFDLSCALKFLHEHCVMYRDIKPDNIGFDVRGDIKLFDFGLAREFDPNKRDANGLFKFTGDTGSPRYMDPQIALNKPYNERCDVYSFSILLWQMQELESPFDGYTMSMFTKRVINGGARPTINPKLPSDMQELMRSGWGDISTRPSMIDVSETLRKIINQFSDKEVKEFTDVSRKGDESLREAQMRSKSLYSKRTLINATSNVSC